MFRGFDDFFVAELGEHALHRRIKDRRVMALAASVWRDLQIKQHGAEHAEYCTPPAISAEARRFQCLSRLWERSGSLEDARSAEGLPHELRT